MDPKDHDALRRLLVDNPELEAIEARVARFNLFEACGLVRHEIRHSNFLAFLLDPSQPHGLGDTFLKWLLQETLGSEEAQGLRSLSPLRLHLADLGASVVRREWRNIDILVENADLRLVVAIENKIGIGEHSDQLARYRQTLEREYPGDWQKVLLLLSPHASAPTDEAYLAVGYGAIHALLTKTLERLGSGLGPDIALVLRHYKELLATHVIDDPELDKLCDEIYRKHRRALDLIFERRGNLRTYLLDAAVTWVGTKSDTVFPDNVHPGIVKFVPREWEEFSPVVYEKEGAPLRSLCVQIRVEQDRVQTWVEMHRGPEEFRARMHALVEANPSIFPTRGVRRHDVNSVFFRKEILSANEFSSSDRVSLESKLFTALDDLIDQHIPRLTAAFRESFNGVSSG